jgi:hypothetical protein
MEALLLTAALVTVMVLALIALARVWVPSSRLGGYRRTHGSDGIEQGPQSREDDDARWHWGGGNPGS